MMACNTIQYHLSITLSRYIIISISNIHIPTAIAIRANFIREDRPKPTDTV